MKDLRWAFLCLLALVAAGAAPVGTAPAAPAGAVPAGMGAAPVGTAPVGAACIPGTTLVNNEKDPTRVAVGRESVHYPGQLKEMPLAKRPDYEDTQVYLLAQADVFLFGVAPIVPESWCYDTEKNSIRFSDSRLRAIPLLGDGQPVDVPAGAAIWAGYYSRKDYDPDCVAGIFLNYLKGGPNGTFGQQYFEYEPAQTRQSLEKKPEPDKQMYLYAGMWVYGYDWCYARADNSVRFLRQPVRLYTVGGIPGRELDRQGIWAGFVPQGSDSMLATDAPLCEDPDGKMRLRLRGPRINPSLPQAGTFEFDGTAGL